LEFIEHRCSFPYFRPMHRCHPPPALTVWFRRAGHGSAVKVKAVEEMSAGFWECLQHIATTPCRCNCWHASVGACADVLPLHPTSLTSVPPPHNLRTLLAHVARSGSCAHVLPLDKRPPLPPLSLLGRRAPAARPALPDLHHQREPGGRRSLPLRAGRASDLLLLVATWTSAGAIS
jgi:hypothetical protein